MIIKGYKGVIDLDLTQVDPIYHKLLIKQHKTDIENYKKYQEKLEPEMRYENSIGKVISDREYYNKLRDIKVQIKKEEENNYYRELTERYYG
tara:strand:- start:123 stop:398 length:276 start_codon:yes stop_codon:yes gene_type:complete